MTTPRWIRACLLPGCMAAGLLAGPAAATAQNTESYTLEEVLSRLQGGAARIGFATANPGAAARLDSLGQLLRALSAAQLTTDEMAQAVTSGPVGVREIARWRTDHLEQLREPLLRDALLSLVEVANISLAPRLSDGLPEPAVDSILAPVTALHREVLRLAQAGNEEKLRRFEIKYGPDAPRLNAAEVGLNYLAQWVPGFAPAGDGSPSPLELVAAYHVTDLTPTWEDDDFDLRIVSSGEVGVRHYSFGAREEEEGRLARLLRPRHRSLGLLLMGPRDEPLHRVWGDDLRTGVFLGWGALHLGYLWDSPQRLIIGNSTQIIPYLF